MKEIEDLAKPNASEGNHSPGRRDEPLVNPLGEQESYDPFEDRSVTSRFLSLLRRIAKRVKRALGKLRFAQDSDLSAGLDSAEYADEEILFPQEKRESAKASRMKMRKQSKSIQALRWTAILLFVFLLGHLTRPEVLENTFKNLTQWKSAVFEKVEPVKEIISDRVTEIVEKKAPEIKEPQRKIKYWQAPMNPGYISDKPGKSPMGMDLVPVYEGEEDFGEGFLINPIVVQNIGVKTEKIKERILTREIRTVGILTYDERKVTHIHTKYKGWVEKLYVDFTGQEVNQDDLLAEVYSPELVSTQEELLVAMKYKQSLQDSPFTDIGKGAERLFESTKRRLELFDVPEHQIEALIRDKKITKTLHIHSPFRGFVVKKDASQGMFVQPGMSLYTIADLTNIWVLADIYEYELPWIKIGQKVEMSLSYYPGRKFKGKVTYIDPFMDPKTRTLKVRMEFDNSKWELKPDMYANITLKSVISKKSIAVPEEAVIHSGEKEIAVVQNSSGTFESRELTLGAQANGYYQVLKGLSAGETVVTSSGFLIDSESKLKEALGKMQAEKQRPDQKKGMAEMGTAMDMPVDQKEKQKKLPGIVEVHPEKLDMKNPGH